MKKIASQVMVGKCDDGEMSMTDRKLLAQLSGDGARDAFEELVARHSPRVYAATFRILRDRQWAEDATQACFLILHRRGSSLPSTTVIAGWLHGCAVLCARSILRQELRLKKRERMATPVVSPPLDNQQTTLVEREDVTGMLENLKPELDIALSRLPQPQREALVLRYLYGASQSEVARQMACSEETIHTRVRRGLEKLRRMLSKDERRLSISALAAFLVEHTSEDVPESLAHSITESCLSGTGLSSAALSAAKVMESGLITLKSLMVILACCVLASAFYFAPLLQILQTPAAVEALPQLRNEKQSESRSVKVAERAPEIVAVKKPAKPLFAPGAMKRFFYGQDKNWRRFGSLRLKETGERVEMGIRNTRTTHWHAGGMLFPQAWDLTKGTLTFSMTCDSATDLARHWVGVCLVPSDGNREGQLEEALAEAALYQPRQTWEPLRAHLKKTMFERKTVRTEVTVSRKRMTLRIDGAEILSAPRDSLDGVFVGFRALARDVKAEQLALLTEIDIQWIPNAPDKEDGF